MGDNLKSQNPNATLRRRNVPQVQEDQPDTGLTKTLKKIDFFEKVKDEVIDTKTKSGGFFSVITFIIICIIVISEINYYFFKESHKYNYKVDTTSDKHDQHILLTFDIIVKTPCSQIGAGVSDEAGADIRSLDDISEQPAYFEMENSEQARYEKVAALQKKQLKDDQILLRNLNSDVLPPSTKPLESDIKKKEKQKSNALAVQQPNPFAMMGGRQMGGLGDIGAIMQQMMAASQAMDQMFNNMNNPMAELAKPSYNQGPKGQTPDSCRFFGTTNLAKVKGTLHIVEGKKIKLGGMMGMMQIVTFNQKRPSFQHRINQLRFSVVDQDKKTLAEIDANDDDFLNQLKTQLAQNEPDKDYSLQALDAHVSNDHGGLYNYFLSVVGIKFKNNQKDRKYAKKYYQFSVTETDEKQDGGHDHGGIMFKYDFSPILVEIENKNQTSLFLFLIRMCSIVGGVLSLSKFLTQMTWCIS